jgi:osmotically-inducible protein OsmY
MILGKCPYFSLRGVQCEFDEGVLILRGRVPSFYLKQVAQTLVRGVPGVERVANQLQVASPEPLIEYHGAQ